MGETAYSLSSTKRYVRNLKHEINYLIIGLSSSLYISLNHVRLNIWNIFRFRENSEKIISRKPWHFSKKKGEGARRREVKNKVRPVCCDESNSCPLRTVASTISISLSRLMDIQPIGQIAHRTNSHPGMKPHEFSWVDRHIPSVRTISEPRRVWAGFVRVRWARMPAKVADWLADKAALQHLAG